MLVTLYNGASDPIPEAYELSGLHDLCLDFMKNGHRRADPEGKKQKTPLWTPAFSPCEFDGQGRELRNALRVHFGAIDIDKVETSKLTAFLEATSTLQSMVYSTFSHGVAGDGKVSCRYLFALSRPVEIKEWERFITGMQAISDGLIDKQTMNADRLFYVPIARNNAPAPPAWGSPFMFYNQGTPPADKVDVDRVIALGSTYVKVRQQAERKGMKDVDEASLAPGYKLTKSDLQSVAHTLKSKRSVKLKEIARTFDKWADGHAPYAADGEKDSVIWKCVCQLSEFFPYADPASLGPLVYQSVSATNTQNKNGNDDDDDVEAIISKYERAQRTAQSKIENAQEEAERSQAALIREAFQREDTERDQPYTEEELAAFQAKLGIDEAIMRKRWLIQCGTAYYVFFNGAYLPPVTEKALVTSAIRDLSPAITAEVSPYIVTEKGEMATLEPKNLMALYGTAARKTHIDLSAQETVYNAQEQTIIEAPCPLRPLVPMFHPKVHEWLLGLGGSAADKLLQWVAFASDISNPCVALYLHGDPGCGKSLFANAIAHLWKSNLPSEMDRALEGFNDVMLNNPVIFADEYVPKDVLSEGTKVLRQFQQMRGRSINRKNMPIASMTGCIRLIMAANNKNLLETTESLTASDIAGVAERILYVRADDERARRALKAFGSDAEIKKIADEHWLAEHSLYLRDHRAELGIAAPSGRFLIENGEHNLSRALTTHSGQRSMVLHWLVSYLQRPERYNAQGAYYCHVREGQLWVNAQALSESWELYSTNTKPPTVHKISQALAGLSNSNRKQARINNKAIWFHTIDTENLLTWAEENGISNRDEILAALQRPTVTDGKQGPKLVPTNMQQTATAAESTGMFPEHRLK